MTIAVVDSGGALQLSDRVAILEGGRIVEILPAQLLGESTQEPTKSLLATLPVPLDVMMRYAGSAKQEDPAARCSKVA